MTYKKDSKKLKTILTIVLTVALVSAAAFGITAVIRGISEQQKKMEHERLLEAYPRKYSETVEKYCAEYEVPEYIVYAVIKAESSFRPDAVSKAGAVGLMQMMPDTLYWVDSKIHEEYTPDMLTDPEVNIRCGVYLLSFLYYNDFSDWDCAFAAYNAGRGRVKSWLENPEYSEDGKLTYIPIKETATYVKRVNSYAEQYYGLYYGAEGETADA